MSTLSDDSFNADHGADEARHEIPRSDLVEPKRTTKSHEDTLPFLEVLWIQIPCDLGQSIRDRLHVLRRITNQPGNTIQSA